MAQRALIIDPSPLYRKLIGHILEEKGLEVVCEAYPDRALAQLQHADQPFDFVTLAYHLEGETCKGLCTRIRAALPDTLLPILVLTTETDHAIVTELLSAGATEVFSKQHLEKFYQYIEHHLLHTSRQILEPGEVLLIEDDRSMAAVIKATLETINQDTTHYLTAEEGLDALTKAPSQFNLVITDVILPGEMNALTFISQIRRRREFDDLPILALSGLDDISQRLSLLQGGANDFVSKPFHMEEFRVRVANLIRTKLLVDQVKAQQKKLHELAMRDPLTGLYNRNFLTESAALRISEARRHGHPLSILLADVDHFKKVNDTWGHDTGDRVLVEIGNYLRGQARKEDVVARMGGEEFMILLYHCSLENAVKRADFLRAGVEALQPDGRHVTMSVGVTSLMNPGEDFQTLYKRADLALYEAKKRGRNRICRLPE
ncbi:diguanylate cyclase [Hahella sp. SMD15-11]|uniref:diguanylate cyclase n=1 Tax=Thermohahella caldifontis TaxID=3142973 RepID=A0AB39USR9_9GAMM